MGDMTDDQLSMDARVEASHESPRTQAGRDLLADFARQWPDPVYPTVDDVADTIAAIEAEALPSVEQLAQALAEWWSNDGSMPGTGSWEAAGGWSTDAAAILAALPPEPTGAER